MKLSRRSSLLLALISLFALGSSPPTAAQEEGDDGGVRKLAPGVETTPPRAIEEQETVAEHNIIELVPGHPGLKWQPQENELSKTLHRISQRVLFRRGVWELQITFKPLRLIRVDIPQLNGKMKNELIWYMVYRITNPGAHMTPLKVKQVVKDLNTDAKYTKERFEIRRVNAPDEMLASIGEHRFVPTFLLRTHGTDKLAVDEATVQHFDEVIPAARREIFIKERPACAFEEFYDTVQMGKDAIPVSTDRQQISRYGVVMWRGIDPTVDYLTLQIMGLTNAYLWADPAGAFKPGDVAGTGRRFVYKTLQLNFYRPGDEFDAREEEIKLGVKGHPEWQWLYRPNPFTYKPARPVK
jgi:hypothetical protein